MKQTRRHFLGSLIAGCAVASGMTRATFASSGVQLPGWGDDPAGSQKAGPLGLASGTRQANDPGQIPVSIVIPAAEVDAEVERTKIVDGQMLDPSGPWIVAWYEGTGLAGEANNSVMSGHVDYWDVGPAVFRNVANLAQGSEITVQGEAGGAYTYAVEYIERIEVATLTQEKLNEIVGPTDYPALTLITCGGEFDYANGEYYQRDIVRARLVGGDAGPAADADTAGDKAAAAGEALARGAAAVVTNDVNLRADASTSKDPVTVLKSGDQVTIAGDPQDAEGYVWWPVETADGTRGWIVDGFLAPAQ